MALYDQLAPLSRAAVGLSPRIIRISVALDGFKRDRDLRKRLQGDGTWPPAGGRI